jgi:hypothetical protein
MTRVRIAAIGAAALLSFWIPGCSSGGEGLALNAAELQNSLQEKLVQAGTPPTAVNCRRALPGVVGQTVRCEVVFADARRVDAVLTTTNVDGDTIDYEITGPELTKDQLDQRVATLAFAQSAACDSGLTGQPGDWAQCEVTAGGRTSNRTVTVRGVQGLMIDLAVTQMLPKPQLEDALLTRLTPTYGRRPDSAACLGDLMGEPGKTTECVVVFDGNPDTYIVTVTEIGGGTVNFKYESK